MSPSLGELFDQLDTAYQAIIDGCDGATGLTVTIQFTDGPQASNAMTKQYVKEG